MDYLVLYGLLLMVVASILINRVLRRYLRAQVKRNDSLRFRAESLTTEIARAEAMERELRSAIVDMTDRLEAAELELQNAARQLESKKAQPVRRYHVFDRLEPRPGAFWECEVVLESPPVGARRAYLKSWEQGRVYVLVAGTAAEARARMEMRFSRQAGFQLRALRPCVLVDPAEMAARAAVAKAAAVDVGGGADPTDGPVKEAGGSRREFVRSKK